MSSRMGLGLALRLERKLHTLTPFAQGKVKVAIRDFEDRLEADIYNDLVDMLHVHRMIERNGKRVCNPRR